MRIKTGRLTLVSSTLEILEEIVNLSNRQTGLITAEISPEWRRNFKEIAPYFMKELEENPDSVGWFVWFIIENSSNMVIGDAGFKGSPSESGTVEVGYSISCSNRNKGYATEAVKSLIEWAFKGDKVRKIIAECERSNKPSIRVLEKVGMKKTGFDKNLIKWQIKINDMGGDRE